MRSTPLVLASFLSLALAAGCSSSKSSSSAAGDDGGADAGSLVTVSYQMSLDVPAGSEYFKCQMVTLPNAQAFMVEGEHNYTPGSHHLLLFTTALTSIPAGLDQVQDCYEGTGSNIMSYMRGMLYGGQTPTGSQTFPPSIGLPTTAGEVLIFQVHYLNATASDLQAQVNVNLTLDTNPADITIYAGNLLLADPFIDVPAGATATAAMRCPIPDDITLLFASSHYHSRGVGYSAWIDPLPTQLGTTPFYTSASWNSPPLAQMTLPVAAGSMLRWQCDYDNSQGTAEYFQGQSALTDEMCIFAGSYYPDMGIGADYCLTGGDMFGVGSTACGDTLTCLQACGGKISSGGITGGTPSDCEQKCMVQSCPTAADPLMPVVTCLQSSCASECATAGSGDCTTCLTSSCAMTYQACSQHTCN
jgi:hypothetical protein